MAEKTTQAAEMLPEVRRQSLSGFGTVGLSYFSAKLSCLRAPALSQSTMATSRIAPSP